MGWRNGFNLAQMIRVELIDPGDTEQAHGGDDLVFEYFENPHQARLTRGGESPALQFADSDGARAQGDRLEHVAAAHDAAVEDDLGAPVHRIDDFRQHIDGRATVIQLASAM